MDKAKHITDVSDATTDSGKEQDIWRDTPLRYLGYANEVGEAFGPLYPKYVRPSYAVAFLYVGCDTGDKFIKSTTISDLTPPFETGNWSILCVVLGSLCRVWCVCAVYSVPRSVFCIPCLSVPADIIRLSCLTCNLPNVLFGCVR